MATGEQLEQAFSGRIGGQEVRQQRRFRRIAKGIKSGFLLASVGLERRQVNHLLVEQLSFAPLEFLHLPLMRAGTFPIRLNQLPLPVGHRLERQGIHSGFPFAARAYGDREDRKR